MKKRKKKKSGSTIDLTVCIQNRSINRRRKKNQQIEKEFDQIMMHFIVWIFILFSSFEQIKTQNHPYKHYSRHPTGETIYDNNTISGNEDDSSMCHLSVRCPAIPSFCK